MKGLPIAALAAAAFLVPGAASAQAGSGKPANLCKELVAYVHPPAPPPAPAPAPGASSAQPAPAVQAPQPGQPSGGASPAAGDTQQKSGLSGPVPQSGPGASGPQGTAQAEAKPAAPPPAAPATPAPPPPLKPTPEMIERVDAAARDNNIAACRDAARQMRVAGIPMPAPLLALSALDLKFFEGVQ
ncbi:hypothetical protein U8607_14625 [Methylobacterium durans]|uniref:hypothetical protein n=1 Tax=Methylobacterium durans TaxID=2202825 RepID=UPI002AFFF026|nr:hypothetical protein [Methylobacterium durans]MEA1833317.1 hypothetical protein [Methylobacterium durans]